MGNVEIYIIYDYLSTFVIKDVDSSDVDLMGYCSFLIMTEVVI